MINPLLLIIAIGAMAKGVNAGKMARRRSLQRMVRRGRFLARSLFWFRPAFRECAKLREFLERLCMRDDDRNRLLSNRTKVRHALTGDESILKGSLARNHI